MSVLTIMATASSTATTPRQATFVPVDLATKLTQMIHERAEVCMATYSMHVLYSANWLCLLLLPNLLFLSHHYLNFRTLLSPTKPYVIPPLPP